MYNDFMSRLVRDSCSIFILLTLLSKSLEFLMYELLIVPKRGYNILTKDSVMLWEDSSNPRNNWNSWFLSFGKTINFED